MKKIGLIFAIEASAVEERYGKMEELDAPKGYKLYKVVKDNAEMYILRSGMGEIYASAGAQYLISACGVEAIINFGVVGGLTPDMKNRKICVVSRVVNYKYDISEMLPEYVPGQMDGKDGIFIPTDPSLLASALSIAPDLFVATDCSGDKFVGTAEEKKYLHDTFEGDICDMESAGIVLACELNSIPCLLFKAVSDGLADGEKGFFEELNDASLVCLRLTDEIIDKIV